MNSFTKNEIENQLKELGNSWQYDGRKIYRDYNFISFKDAIDAFNAFCLIVEKHNHHPTFISDYNNLSVEICTHDVNGITQKDFDLARAINKLKL